MRPASVSDGWLVGAGWGPLIEQVCVVGRRWARGEFDILSLFVLRILTCLNEAWVRHRLEYLAGTGYELVERRKTYLDVLGIGWGHAKREANDKHNKGALNRLGEGNRYCGCVLCPFRKTGKGWIRDQRGKWPSCTHPTQPVIAQHQREEESQHELMAGRSIVEVGYLWWRLTVVLCVWN